MKNIKKSVRLIIFLLFLAFFITLAVGIYKFNFTNKDIYLQTGGRLDSKDAAYLIDGQTINLKNGYAESDTIPGSASKTITRYFGNDAKGDLNGDGQEDVAFLLTQETGGSGTFFYVAVALKEGNEYRGLNAILLGDRIAPQTTEIKEGKIIVNYADRKEGEAMSIAPSVGVSRYFSVQNRQLVEVK